MSTQEALKQLEEIIRGINEAEREQAECGISGEAFATLWILQQRGVPFSQAQEAAGQMASVLGEFPHWQRSDKQARQVRRRLYPLLEQAGERMAISRKQLRR